MTDGVDAAVELMKPPGVEPAPDFTPAYPQICELRTRHNPVLPLGKARDLGIGFVSLL